MILKSNGKFEGKLTYGLENDMRNLEIFFPEHSKFQNWNFDVIFLFKVQNL